MITSEAEIFDSLTIPGASVRMFPRRGAPTEVYVMLRISPTPTLALIRRGALEVQKAGRRPKGQPGLMIVIRCMACGVLDPGEKGWAFDEEDGGCLCPRCAGWRVRGGPQ